MWRPACLSLALFLGLASVAGAAPSSAPAAEESSAHDLDRLYDRLARTRFPDEAAGIIAEIDHLRLRSGSDTADLLLGRAMKARASSDLPLALKLFDAVVDLYPDWPEAWSERATARFLVISFTSDWLYPSYQSLEIVNALRSRNHDVTYCELTSNYGHDAFLVDVAEQTEVIRGFLARCHSEFREAGR